MPGHYYLHGEDVKFYLNTGTHATPVWLELKDVEEPLVDLSKVQSDLKPRGVKFNLKHGKRFEAPLSFMYDVPVDPTDPVLLKLWSSFTLLTPVNFAISSAAISGTTAFGFKGWYEISSFPIKAPGEGGFQIEVKADLTDYQETGPLIAPAFITPA